MRYVVRAEVLKGLPAAIQGAALKDVALSTGFSCPGIYPAIIAASCMYADLKRGVAQPAFSYPCIYTVIEISCMYCDFKKAVAQHGINTIIEISRYAL